MSSANHDSIKDSSVPSSVSVTTSYWPVSEKSGRFVMLAHGGLKAKDRHLFSASHLGTSCNDCMVTMFVISSGSSESHVRKPFNIGLSSLEKLNNLCKVSKRVIKIRLKTSEWLHCKEETFSCYFWWEEDELKILNVGKWVWPIINSVQTSSYFFSNGFMNKNPVFLSSEKILNFILNETGFRKGN